MDDSDCPITEFDIIAAALVFVAVIVDDSARVLPIDAALLTAEAMV